MTIEYKLNENDFLIHQLFVASKSDRIKKKRQRSRFFIPLVYIAIGFWFFFQERVSLAIIFFIIGILWFLIYPTFERRRYINHYKGFIRENYKERLGLSASLELNDDFIIAKDNGNESKILTRELKEINEIQTTIFVRLKGGQSFIIPKDSISNIDNLRTRLQELANYLNIKYDIDNKWEWK